MKPDRCRVAPLNIVCPRIPPPAIDGCIGEREWDRAAQLTRFTREGGSTARARTVVWVARDEGYLYVAARCEERNTGALRHTGSPYLRDLYSRDHVDVYVNPEHDHVSYRRFTVGPFEQTESARGSYRLSWRAGPDSRWFHTADEARIHPMYVRYASTVDEGCAWFFDWSDGSLPLHYLHKGETDGPVADPDPSDPDFLVKKACWIAARQHRFYRRNTKQGAPSDFTLESADGSARFNLMDPKCVTEMAQYVYDSYDNDADRLLGMMFFAGQPALMRAHTAYDPGASHRLETLSLLRFGSGYCGHMSRVMATILNEMEVGDTGRRHRARNFGIGGHALVLVEYRDDYAILDPTHPSLYYRLDNSDLATLKEYREQPEIGRRADPSHMPALMTFNRDHIPEYPCDTLDGRGLILP